MDLKQKKEARIKAAKDLYGLTREEMHEVAKKRVNEVVREFSEGFTLLENFPQSVTFFGSNQFREENLHYQNARTLAGRIAKELGYAVVSGGGPGIMEAANRGAFESGGKSVGLTIKLPREQVINEYITDKFDCYYFFARKVLLSFSAEAFIFYPGGYGTLDEFFEIITLVQTGKIVGIPIICVGTDYWKPLERFMQSELLGRGAILPEDLLLYTVTDDHDQVIDIIKNVPVRAGIPWNGTGLDMEVVANE